MLFDNYLHIFWNKWGYVSMLQNEVENVKTGWNMLNEGANVGKWGCKIVDEFENPEQTLKCCENNIRPF